MRNNEKGMSLMAWTVTVIVLVILAFILVAMFTGLGEVVDQKQSANTTTTANEELEENTEEVVEDENVDTEEENTEVEEEENVEAEETNTETEENDTDSNEAVEE